LGTSRELFTYIKELMDSGIRLDDISRLCLLLVTMGRQGNRYVHLKKKILMFRSHDSSMRYMNSIQSSP
jgi:hypothetical protein